MAYPSRVAVYGALFARLYGLPGFMTYTQRAVLPADITADNSPLLSLLHGNGEDTYDGNRLEKREWDAYIVIYFLKIDLTVPGSTIIDPLLDTVYDALQPDNLLQNVLVLRDPITGQQLASWVRIEGTTVVENGDTDTQGLGGALIPIRMLVP
jgi:hypothetical protein